MDNPPVEGENQFDSGYDLDVTILYKASRSLKYLDILT